MKDAVLVTGATSGLGSATVRRLAAEGRPVIVGGRRREAVDHLTAQIQASGGTAFSFVADLSRLAEVRQALADADWPPLMGIIANAGITVAKPKTSPDGFELTFAVNVLAHQLIVARLAERLTSPCRVVFVSSGTQIPEHKLARRFGIPPPRWLGAEALAYPDRVDQGERITDLRQTYSTSKLGNVLQARAFQQRLRDAGIKADVFAIDPGLMPQTNLAREAPAPLRWIFQGVGKAVTPWVEGMRTVNTSATHLASLIEDERWSNQGFKYLDGDTPYPASDDGMNDAYRDALWQDAARLIGLQTDETILPL